MAEITNANDVRLVVRAVGVDDGIGLTDRARIVVDDFNFTIEEENEALSGVGNHTPVGVTRGDVEYTYSFTVQGEDGDLLQTIATSNGRSREIEFVATGRTFVVKMASGYLTSLSYDGNSGEAVEWAVDGLAVTADLRPLDE